MWRARTITRASSIPQRACARVLQKHPPQKQRAQGKPGARCIADKAFDSNSIIANLNAQGGIIGRKLVPYLAAVNPVGTGPAITACTQLSEDDSVFVAINPQQSDCFLQQHHVPTISGTFQDAPSTSATPNFTLQPPPVAYDPVQLAVLAHHGDFKGKRVGLFAGQETDGKRALGREGRPPGRVDGRVNLREDQSRVIQEDLAPRRQ